MHGFLDGYLKNKQNRSFQRRLENARPLRFEHQSQKPTRTSSYLIRTRNLYIYRTHSVDKKQHCLSIGQTRDNFETSFDLPETEKEISISTCREIRVVNHLHRFEYTIISTTFE